MTLVAAGSTTPGGTFPSPRRSMGPTHSAPARPVVLSAWPLVGTLALYPLWWALGLGVLIFPDHGRADGGAAGPHARRRPAGPAPTRLRLVGAVPAGGRRQHRGARGGPARHRGRTRHRPADRGRLPPPDVPVADRAARLRGQPRRHGTTATPPGAAAQLALRGHRGRRAARHVRRAVRLHLAGGDAAAGGNPRARVSCSPWCTRTPRRSWIWSARPHPARPPRGATPTPGATTSACWWSGSWWRSGPTRSGVPG